MGDSFKPTGKSKSKEKLLYKSHVPGKGVRPKRVAETIRQAISSLLVQGRVENLPLGAFITVGDVDVSPDLAQAAVYVSWFDESKEGRERLIMEALRDAEPMVRNFLAQTLLLRRAPKVTFKYAGTQERVENIEALFRSPVVQKDIKE